MAEITHGQVNLNTVLGAIGTAGAVMPGVLGNIFGNGCGGGNCSENMHVTRYDAAKDARIAALETEVKLRDANTYTDSKMLEMYKYVDGKFGKIEHQLCEQSVWNATQGGVLSCISGQIAQLQSLTKCIIPADNICPPPMSLYNSWTAPTTTTTAAG